MVWDEMAVVGRIARAHGNRGQVIVNLDTDFPEARFQVGAELFARRGARVEALRLTSVRFQHARPVVGIEGIETMNDAEALAGQELRVPLDRLTPLPPGTFYHHDLVGCRVETRAGTAVGVVREVDAALGGVRLVVESAAGDVLIPLVAAICTAVDPGAKRIVIDPPDGLLDLNASRADR
jgi:16S rRNA processing protein RimM